MPVKTPIGSLSSSFVFTCGTHHTFFHRILDFSLKGSAESSYSQHSSEGSSGGQSTGVASGQTGGISLKELLDRARTKQVAFAVRTTVAYDAATDDQVPMPGYGVGFPVKSFLHIKDVCLSYTWRLFSLDSLTFLSI